MSFRSWMYVFAIVGLISAIPAGIYSWISFSTYQEQQSYERITAAQDNATAAEKSPQDCRPAMVESSVFDWLACLGEKITADSGVKQAEYDLKAQQDMASWAFGMLIVTIWLSAITLLGVLFVGWTLVATRKMAFDTREMMGKQMRAYLGWNESYYADKNENFVFSGSKIIAKLPIKNFGTTPARAARYEIQSTSKSGDVLASGKGVIGSIAPSDTQVIEFDCVKPSEKSAVYVEVKISYDTVGEKGATRINIRSGVNDAGRITSGAKILDNGQDIE